MPSNKRGTCKGGRSRTGNAPANPATTSLRMTNSQAKEKAPGENEHNTQSLQKPQETSIAGKEELLTLAVGGKADRESRGSSDAEFSAPASDAAESEQRSRRQRKQAGKKAMKDAAEQVKNGTIVIPSASANINGVHRPNDEGSRDDGGARSDLPEDEHDSYRNASTLAKVQQGEGYRTRALDGLEMGEKHEKQQVKATAGKTELDDTTKAFGELGIGQLESRRVEPAEWRKQHTNSLRARLAELRAMLGEKRGYEKALKARLEKDKGELKDLQRRTRELQVANGDIPSDYTMKVEKKKKR